MSANRTTRRWYTFLIFAAVGIVNTLVDAVLYAVLRAQGLPVVTANTISTSAALLTSFVLNKRFTFSGRDSGRRAIVPFLIITLAGIWILQPLVIYAVQPVFGLGAVQDIVGWLYGESQTVQDVLSKLAASAASLVWNYLLYSRFVFKSATTIVAKA